MYNRPTITQLGMCKVKLQYYNKQKNLQIFVVPGNGQALLVMPEIDILNNITINFNTIVTKETNKADKCSTNTVIHQDSRHQQHYTNIMQEANRAEKCM